MSGIKRLVSFKGSASDLDLNSLFEEFYDRLVYFSHQILKDQTQAQDIAQEAFISYWREKDSIEVNKTAIKNYLYKSARNASLNLIRHEKVVQQYNQKQGAEEPEEPPVIDAIISSEVIAQIHLAIELLPGTYRQICTLGFIEGKKNQEIADELGMSINTVKKQKQKVLDLLRRRLSPELFFALMFYHENTPALL
ncbi:RNA polymerase sigma-70 factor [Dyadobacter sp. CY343]|uniref:RNA polymerase sigma-70 factor n=1 Tax=Dyadobacter sp. CY343 TaxID=2907299 RepID=UPI001F33E463|nr:RNA polymerase sigma-70 factor [Dyadobacter sp. CY343]MCE7063395.1 RNA polymerase sigma-70 factor [Dyadobacter sp. CY343]